MKKVVRLSENDLTRLVRKIISETVVAEQDNSRYDKKVAGLTQNGYRVTDKISLPDGEYDLSGMGYVCYLNKDKKNTGYAYVTTGGIRGSWANSGAKVNVVGGKIPQVEYGEVYKILYNKSEVGKPMSEL
jgi:hypothetical protein